MAHRKFLPSEGYAPAFENTMATSVTRVNLREVPLETVILFCGFHPDSWYLAQVVGPNSERQVKLWHKENGKAVIGSIDAIISFRNIQDFLNKTVERGVMEVGKQYILPYFSHTIEDGTSKVVLEGSRRIEYYTEIHVQRSGIY